MHWRNLRKVRDLCGLTQRELARMARIDRPTLSLAETGQLCLSDTQMKSVERVLRRVLAEQAAAISKLLNQEERQTVSV